MIVFFLSLLIFFIPKYFLAESNVSQEINQEQRQNENKENSQEETEKIIPTQAKVPILIYHHIRDFSAKDSTNDKTFIVPAVDFSKQLEYLKNEGFESILFKDLIDYFNGDFSMPDKPVIISFDDGLKNQFNNAFPLLVENGFKATFFIFTNPIGKNSNYMNWEEVNQLHDAGMEIGVHGHYHLFLDRISQEELEKEIVLSRQIIEDNINSEVSVIAYPFGSYNEDAINKLKGKGYLAARGITNGVFHTKDDMFKLKGYFITDNFSRFKNIVD